MDEQTIQAVYAYIRVYLHQYGYGPSIREIARDCFMSPANVYRYLDWLEARGYITRQSGVARSIRLLEHNES